MMKLKIYILLIVILFYTPLLCSQNIKEEQFKETVKKLITSYSLKNTTQINSLINSDLGVYILATSGSLPYWFHCHNLPMNQKDQSDCLLPIPINQQLLEQKLFLHFNLQYSNYPIIECESASKKGLFVDTTSINREFSSLIKENIDLAESKDRKKIKSFYDSIYELESNTRKIILSFDKVDCYPYFNHNFKNGYWGNIFIFYLTYIDYKWYLTIVDFTDCFLS